MGAPAEGTSCLEVVVRLILLLIAIGILLRVLGWVF